eukprot:2406382-Ditylum_brightwellii.AAC.1
MAQAAFKIKTGGCCDDDDESEEVNAARNTGELEAKSNVMEPIMARPVLYGMAAVVVVALVAVVVMSCAMSDKISMGG